MNIYVFVKSAWWYFQYPRNDAYKFKDLLKEARKRERNENTRIADQILVQKVDHTLYYTYIRRLYDDDRIGIGVEHNAICTDFSKLFDQFRKIIEDMGTNKLVIEKLKKAEQYKLSKKNKIIIKNNYDKNVFNTKLNLFIDKCEKELLNGAFAGAKPLPPGNLGIGIGDIIQDRLGKQDNFEIHDSSWFVNKIEQGYCNVYIRPETDLKIPGLSRKKKFFIFILVFYVVYVTSEIVNVCTPKHGQKSVAKTSDTMIVDTIATNTGIQRIKTLRTKENTSKSNHSRQKSGDDNPDNKYSQNMHRTNKSRTNEPLAEKKLSRAERFLSAKRTNDWSEMRKLADEGYRNAYMPLAQHYLKNTSQHKLAYKYANMAKNAGVYGADSILKKLELLDY